MLIFFLKFTEFIYKYISNYEMNPWIVSTSEIQKKIMYDWWFKILSKIKVLFGFKSYSFVSRHINKIHLFCFPSNLCFISRFIPFSVPRFIKPIEQWILHGHHCHLEYNKNTCRGKAPYAWGIRDERCMMKHSCVHVKQNSWCENQAKKPIFKKKKLHYQLFSYFKYWNLMLTK